MTTRAELAFRVERNRNHFSKLRSAASRIKEGPELLVRISEAVRYASYNGTGVFRAPELEYKLACVSKTLPAFKSTMRGGVLHVLTTAYLSGGHTRVVERWIGCDSQVRSHSVVLTAQGAHPLPPRLDAAVEGASGQILNLTEDLSPLQKAVILREFASRFDYVVMHTHMDDIVPTLAFAATEFSTIFYNHADHRFSVGMTSASLVVETRTWGQAISLNRRGIHSEVLGIPTTEIRTTYPSENERHAVRSRLDIPATATVAFSAGSGFKYQPMLEYNYPKIVHKALTKQSNLHFLLLGIEQDEFNGIEMAPDQRQRLHFRSITDEVGFRECLGASDFAVDTFPEAGSTTMMDAVASGVPVLSRVNPVSQMDYLVSLPEYGRDDRDLLANVEKFSSCGKYRRDRWDAQISALQAIAGPVAFGSRLEEIYDLSRQQNLSQGDTSLLRDETATELDYLLVSR